MPSGVMRLRAARKLKAKDDERTRPIAQQSKPLKRTNRNPNTRVGAMGDHEDLEPKLSFDPSRSTSDPSAYGSDCLFGHGIMDTHPGPCVTGPASHKARQKWMREQEKRSR
jgi:hypothetical protein